MRTVSNITFFTILCISLTLMVACAHREPLPLETAQQPLYDYPVKNAYAATIIGTPAEMKVRYPDAIEADEEKLVVFPDRKIPEGFWYYNGLLYGQMLQDKAAPLVYIIGGTGAGYKSRFTVALANTLYDSGHHVVMLPSPTHANFIVTASANHFPGNGKTDAEDLYRVMNMIQKRVAQKRAITSTHITGYSLGAWNAAFVSILDQQEKKIGLDKTLLINPPLSLHSSILRLDAMLLQGLPGGIDELDTFLNRTMVRLSQLRNDSDAFDLSNENMLLESYSRLNPTNDKMATTIGLAFRFSAANMIFTSDVMSHANYIYPADRPFRSETPLNDYMAMALRTGFGDYFKDIYSTYYVNNTHGLTYNNLIDQSSLEPLRDWIASNPNIGLITNRDDIILAPGELSKLESLFAGKSWIFPTGGHLGNIEHPAFAWRVANFFEGTQQ